METATGKLINDYKMGDTIYILLEAYRVRSMVEAWLSGDWCCDIRVRRSKKNPGSVVIITTDLVWAARIMDVCGYEQVTTKRNPNNI